MRSHLRSFLLTSALSFIPSLASATTISGLYVDGGSGYNEVQDQHVHANSPASGDAVPKFSVNHGTGFTGFGAVGYGFGNGLRVEAEGLYNFSHDNYTSSYTSENKEEIITEGYPSPVVEYQKGKDLWVKPFGGSKGDFYYLTVQKVDEAPEWMTQLAPVDTGIGFAQMPNHASTTMTSCSDCYFINFNLTQNQVTEVEKGELPNGAPTYSSSVYEEELANFPDGVVGGYFPQGIYYLGDVYNNLKGTLPVSYKDGKLIYSATGNNQLYSVEIIKKGHPLPVPGVYKESQVFNHNGSDESWGGFANVLYDFDLERLFGVKSIATPFIGGGAGYLWQRYNRPNTMIAAITGTHGGFSWQGIAGVAFDTGISGLQVVAQYRMIGQPGSFYNGSFNYGTEGGHAHFDQRFNHQFIVGFRYAFQNQPIHHIQPPAVRPIVTAAPAPVPARSYLVFFDWNQYALTSRARQIVVEAAHATSYVHTTRINVNGYTDSSAAPGPAGQKYNYALSVKRARSVEAELIRNGVPASEIVIRGYGDTNPLVPTAPNTREPQNRRVEIILHA